MCWLEAQHVRASAAPRMQCAGCASGFYPAGWLCRRATYKVNGSPCLAGNAVYFCQERQIFGDRGDWNHWAIQQSLMEADT